MLSIAKIFWKLQFALESTILSQQGKSSSVSCRQSPWHQPRKVKTVKNGTQLSTSVTALTRFLWQGYDSTTSIRLQLCHSQTDFPMTLSRYQPHDINQFFLIYFLFFPFHFLGNHTQLRYATLLLREYLQKNFPLGIRK